LLPLEVDEGILGIKIEKTTNHFSVHYLKDLAKLSAASLTSQ